MNGDLRRNVEEMLKVEILAQTFELSNYFSIALNYLTYLIETVSYGLLVLGCPIMSCLSGSIISSISCINLIYFVGHYSNSHSRWHGGRWYSSPRSPMLAYLKRCGKFCCERLYFDHSQRLLYSKESRQRSCLLPTFIWVYYRRSIFHAYGSNNGFYWFGKCHGLFPGSVPKSPSSDNIKFPVLHANVHANGINRVNCSCQSIKWRKNLRNND